jgi:hypothetical protein
MEELGRSLRIVLLNHDPVHRFRNHDGGGFQTTRPMFEQRVLAISEDVMFKWRLLVEEGRKAVDLSP